MPQRQSQLQPIERAPAPPPDSRPKPDTEKASSRPWYRRPILVVLLAVAILAAAAFGTRYYLHARMYESTDDAFIQANVVPVSPKVASYVLRVHIDDNQHVRQGDRLIELDPRDFEADLRQAKANLDAGKAELVRARLEAKRQRSLVTEQAVSIQEVDNATARERSAGAQVEQLEAAVHQSELNLSYANVFAPTTGRITRKHVEPGSYVQVGQTLFSIVPDVVWVIANFKENQLARMHPGQSVLIHVDAYPGAVFHGHVDSIQAGSGAAFSLLPPENATGNYVKVVQRVPVKILFDDPPDGEHVFGPGMSVVPEVQVR